MSRTAAARQVMIETPQEPELRPQVDSKEAAIRARAEAWIVRAQSFKIADLASCKAASEELLVVKALLDEANETFNPIIAAANKAHVIALDKKRQVVAPLIEAEKILNSAVSQYHVDIEVQRQIEERKRTQVAEQQAAQRREEEILDAERSGADAFEVEALAAAPLHVPPVVLAPKASVTVAGLTARETWRGEVQGTVGLLKLAKYVVDHPEFVGLIEGNDAAINGMARSLKAAMKIPGIRVWPDTTMSRTGGRRIR